MAEREDATARRAGEPHPLDLATRLVDDGALLATSHQIVYFKQ